MLWWLGLHSQQASVVCFCDLSDGLLCFQHYLLAIVVNHVYCHRRYHYHYHIRTGATIVTHECFVRLLPARNPETIRR